MFDHRHYVPVLKGKAGEFSAIEELATADKRAFTPVIEIPAIPWDFTTETPARTIDDHLRPVPAKLASCWQVERPIFVDLQLVPDAEGMSDGRHPLDYVCEGARNVGVSVIPVTGIGRDAAYQAAAARAFETDENGICLRLQAEDIDSEALESDVDALLDSLHVQPEAVDLLVDLGPLPHPINRFFVMTVRTGLQAVPRLSEWRTFTLASAAFPVDLSGFDQDSIESTPRTDWLLWTRLVGAGGHLARLPAYGDYAIAHPELVEVDPRIMRPSASIRYTTDDSWLIVKGRGVRREGFEQFYELSDSLRRRTEYKGPDFSWGDHYINQCADRAEGPGNLTTWRKVATNHHIKLVIEQIANLDAT